MIDFAPDRREKIDRPLDLAGLGGEINRLLSSDNLFCAFRLQGNFRRVRTRSVPAQEKPYPPLAEVTPTQPVFDLADIPGTLIGFRSPAFVRGVNVPGFHMHFLTADLSGGGHVLAFELEKGILEADTIHDWLQIYLPAESEAFAAVDLSRDRNAELEKVGKEMVEPEK